MMQEVTIKQITDSLFDDIQEALIKNYTKTKCKELLEIVAEKAKIGHKTEYTGGTAEILGSYSKRIIACVDKDSILNAVDLETFIV